MLKLVATLGKLIEVDFLDYQEEISKWHEFCSHRDKFVYVNGRTDGKAYALGIAGHAPGPIQLAQYGKFFEHMLGAQVATMQTGLALYKLVKHQALWAARAEQKAEDAKGPSKNKRLVITRDPVHGFVVKVPNNRHKSVGDIIKVSVVDQQRTEIARSNQDPDSDWVKDPTRRSKKEVKLTELLKKARVWSTFSFTFDLKSKSKSRQEAEPIERCREIVPSPDEQLCLEFEDHGWKTRVCASCTTLTIYKQPPGKDCFYASVTLSVDDIAQVVAVSNIELKIPSSRGFVTCCRTIKGKLECKQNDKALFWLHKEQLIELIVCLKKIIEQSSSTIMA